VKLEDLDVVRGLLRHVRVLSLGVIVDAEPHVGLLPFVVAPDFGSVLVHASRLARHTRGLLPGAPFSALIHGPDEPDADPLQVPRLTVAGTVRPLARGEREWEEARRLHLERFPGSAQTFALGDFALYRLQFESGRLVAGFARAVTLRPESFRELAAGEP